MKFLNRFKNRSFFYAIVINAIFMCFFLIVFGCKYELSDDWFVAQNIKNGNCNIAFCNFFIQTLTGILQKMIYPANAFIWLQILFNYVSLTTISYVFLNTFKGKKGYFFILLLLSFFSFNAYAVVTFTKTSAFLFTAGILLMLWAYQHEKHMGYSLFGICLILFGFFYRFEILGSVPVVFFFCICAFVCAKPKRFNLKNIIDVIKTVFSRKTIALLLLTFVVIGLSHVVSEKMIYSQEGMENFKEYNRIRIKVVDYYMPQYSDEKVQSSFQEIGISENDYRMIQNWYLDEQGYADLDTLTQIVQIIKEKDGLSISRLFKNARLYVNFLTAEFPSPEGLLLVGYFVLVLAVLILYKRKSLWFVLGISSGVAVLYCYLFYLGRTNYRSLFSIWFPAIICMLYATKDMEYRENITSFLSKKKVKNIIRGIAVVSMALCLLFTINICIPDIRIDSVLHPMFDEYVSKSKDKVFVLSRYAYPSVRDATSMKNALILNENKTWDQCVYFGTPYLGHPLYKDLLKKNGIHNLYTYMIDNDKFYFVCFKTDEIDMFIAYLNEQYGGNERYTYELVAETEFMIFKIITEK